MDNPREIKSERFLIREMFIGSVLTANPRINVMTIDETHIGHLPRFGGSDKGLNHRYGECQHTLHPDELRELADLIDKWNSTVVTDQNP